jgi:hypothetical protein
MSGAKRSTWFASAPRKRLARLPLHLMEERMFDQMEPLMFAAAMFDTQPRLQHVRWVEEGGDAGLLLCDRTVSRTMRTGEVDVVMVQPGASADAAGIKVGDLVVRVGETEVRTVRQVLEILRAMPAGASVMLTLRRAGRRFERPVIPNPVDVPHDRLGGWM